jgi:cellulose synthase/poly-beta-1,6-N-acetylglucosamine synthase-like glycosyltransferase
VPAENLPTVSVLISAYNEEKDIGWKMEQTLKWDYPAHKIQLLVASDASSDRTDKILQAVRDPRVTCIRMPDRMGKNSALNCLAKLARGEVLFFTDANSDVPPQCLRTLVLYFADARVGCVTGIEDTQTTGKGGAIDSGGGTYLNYESFVNQLESRLGSVLVCDGSIFCMRRSLFSPLQPDLANDLESPIRAGATGHWILYEPLARSREYATRSLVEEFKRRKRICAQGILAAWRLRSSLCGLRAWQFWSRKCLRWLSTVPFVFVFVASGMLARDGLSFRVAFVMQLSFVFAACLGCALSTREANCPRCFSVPFYFLLATSAAMFGLIESIFGRRFGVWSIAQLSRGQRSQDTV